MLQEESIAIIIPVLNEERTLVSIIEVVRTWGRAKEIIVVNDGSKDKTVESLRQFSNQITLISFKKNFGKAHAMVAGTKASSSDIILFLDGDLLGLTHRDLDHLVAPVIKKSAKMTIGARWIHSKCARRFKSIGGERAIRRADLLPILSKIQHLGYGVELYLNNHFQNKNIIYVNMPFVSILVKFEKQSIPDGTISYIKEAVELLKQIAKQQAGHVTPKVGKLYKMIHEYLKTALDYFQ